MNNDIKPSNENFELKIRSCAVIVNDNKILTVQINDCDFLCLPGGHLGLGETTITALKREIREEVEIEIEPIKLLSLIENFYYRPKIKKNSHEIGFYYLCKPLLDDDTKLKDWNFIEEEGQKKTYLKFRWIELIKLKNYDFRPKDLKEQLSNLNFEFSHKINNDLND